MNDRSSDSLRLPTLAGLYSLFDQRPPRARPVDARSVPLPYRDLLAHRNHMTVTVEAFHGVPVSLEVLAVSHREPRYARKILLRRSDDDSVVQFGIMQFDLRQVGEEVRREIVARETPLGRILLEHQLLTRVAPPQLLEIDPDDELRAHFRLAASARRKLYGRLAVIECNGGPAVDLLEVVRPE